MLPVGNFIAELPGLFMQPTVKTLALDTSVEPSCKSLCPYGGCLTTRCFIYVAS